MKRDDFLVELEDILQREEPCLSTDLLEDYDEWDSLSKMALMAFFDKQFGIRLGLKDFKELKTVEDIIKLAGDNIQ